MQQPSHQLLAAGGELCSQLVLRSAIVLRRISEERATIARPVITSFASYDASIGLVDMSHALEAD